MRIVFFCNLILFSNIRLILILLILSIFPLYLYSSNDINSKEQELTELQRMIEEQRQKALQLDKHKSKALQNKQKTQRELNLTHKKIQDLSIAEQNLKKSLNLSKNLLSHTNTIISENQKLCYEAFLFLLFTDQAESKLRQNSNDSFLLSLIFKNIIKENIKLEQKKELIFQEKNKNEQAVKQTLNITQTERQKLNQMSNTIKKLDSDISNFEKQKQAFLHKSKELERDAQALQDLIDFLKKQAERYTESFDFIGEYSWPLIGNIIRHFGPHRHERYDILTISNGVDIAAGLDSDIRAFADGEVVFADWFTGAGKMIILDHKNGFHTIYSYNNTLLVTKGEKIKKGQIIAKVGKTGNATEPSLHFEIRRSGVPLNPMQFKN